MDRRLFKLTMAFMSTVRYVNDVSSGVTLVTKLSIDIVASARLYNIVYRFKYE